MIHYDDRGGNYDFNSKSCNLFSTIRVFSFFFFFSNMVSRSFRHHLRRHFFFVSTSFDRRGGFRFDSRDFNAIFLPISCYDDSTLTFNPTLVSSKNPINRRGKREGKKKKKYNQSESTLQRKETVKETLANRHVYARPSIECQ